MGMGLTTNHCFADGSPRVPVPNWQTVGLDKPAYLWAASLVPVSPVDIIAEIGMADAALMRAIEQHLKDGRFGPAETKADSLLN